MGHESNSANGAMLSPTATAIETSTGTYLDLSAPRGDQFSIEDIASGLAKSCRYGGQINRYFSVAEHSVLVHDLLRWSGADEDMLVAALFHDAAEAFLGDLVAPLKYALRQGQSGGVSTYDVLSNTLDLVIAEKYGIDPALFADEQLRVADMWALRIEAAELTSTGGTNWRWPGELPLDGAMPPDLAEIWNMHHCAMKPKDDLLGRCDTCAQRMLQGSMEPYARQIIEAVHAAGFEKA